MVQKLVPYILLCIVRAFYMKIETYLNESALWMFFDTLFTSENWLSKIKLAIQRLIQKLDKHLR